MTCIVAYVKDGNIHMAGDKLGDNGFVQHISPKPKVFIKGAFIFGYTTSFRMGQLLEHSWAAPPREVAVDDDTYLYRDVVNSFIRLFKDNDYGYKNNRELETGEFLFGWNGRLFYHQGNHSILEVAEYGAVGSGCYHAEAAMMVMLDFNREWEPENLLAGAIKVAAKFVGSVSEEYDYLMLGKEVNK